MPALGHFPRSEHATAFRQHLLPILETILARA
jgi:hypothetical protein